MTGFVGINPVGLVGLADTADHYAARLDLMCGGLSSLLERHVPFAGAGDAMRKASQAMIDVGAQLRWRAGVIEQAQREGLAGTAPLSASRWLADFAAVAVFSLDTWPATFAAWRIEAWLLEMRQLTPAAVAGALAGVTPDQARYMAKMYPELVGDLDGVPAETRYRANRVLVELEIERLESIVNKIRHRGPIDQPSGVVVDRLAGQIQEYRRWIGEGRQILLFDPRGDGRVVEVFGDLEAADHVAVIVPGMANDATNFGAGPGSLRMDAFGLYQATSRTGVATIAWLGYDPPDGVDAAGRTAAERGAPDLARFLGGLDPFDERVVTVVAHSYGSVVAGLAAADGIDADNLVFVGSPGTTLERADDAVLRPGGRVWAALAAGDPIGLGIDPTASFRWWYGFSPLLPVIGVAASMVSRNDLWHGTNPVADEFGAQRIGTDGSSGHSGYFAAGALENLALILEGRYSEVGLAS